jgi:tetratricopeptide (TPR) repeat protein
MEPNPGKPPARTLLEQRIAELRMTLEEFAEHADKFARNHHEPGTLSVRHLQRLIAGKRGDGRPLGSVRPATARLLERILGQPITDLLAAPDLAIQSDSSLELRQALDTAQRVDHSIIALLHEQLDHIRRLDRQLGAVMVREELHAKMRQVHRLFSHSLAPGTREPLAALFSEMATLAGWQALDLCRTAEAWQHYEQAKSAARESGSVAYEAHAAAEQAFVLLDTTRTAEAVFVLESARAKAGRATSPLLRSWLAAAHGEALAAHGRRSASLRAFDHAAAHLPSGDTTTGRPYVALDPAHLVRWHGHILARLVHPDAVSTLTSALGLLDLSFSRAETGLHLDLAAAHCTAGELTKARSHIERAALLAQEIGSNRNRERIRCLSRVVASSS